MLVSFDFVFLFIGDHDEADAGKGLLGHGHDIAAGFLEPDLEFLEPGRQFVEEKEERGEADDEREGQFPINIENDAEKEENLHDVGDHARGGADEEFLYDAYFSDDAAHEVAGFVLVEKAHGEAHDATEDIHADRGHDAHVDVEKDDAAIVFT